MTEWNRESTTIFWTEYGGLHLFVWRMPGQPVETQWRWSVWRGSRELHVSRVGLARHEDAMDAAKSYADQRRYCA